MAARLAAVLALLLLLVSPLRGQEKNRKCTNPEGGMDPAGPDIRGDVRSVDGENLIPAAVQNKAWPGARGDVRQTGDPEPGGCEIIPVTEEPPAPPTKTPTAPQRRPIPPTVPVIPLVPSGRFTVLLPSGGAVVPGQRTGGWFVPVQGLYPPLQVLPYPPRPPQFPLGQVPLTVGVIPWNSRQLLLPANISPVNPLWGIVPRRWGLPRTLAVLGKRRSSEEHNK